MAQVVESSRASNGKKKRKDILSGLGAPFFCSYFIIILRYHLSFFPGLTFAQIYKNNAG
jgi:hypothetical protein